jgi:S-adenosylmethionine-diacylglycerol 3-amino-3-carboxypropyl transferase
VPVRQTLKFAVVREDPELECELVRAGGRRAALVVASGGCTLLTLQARFAELHVAAFDRNPMQLEHVRKKGRAAARGEHAALNIDDPAPSGLNQCGEFEGLFRLLRGALCEFVATPDELSAYFDAGTPRDVRRAWALGCTESHYWPAAFATVFNDALLHAMFGPEATQHAPPGSYPRYFQQAFTRGLLRDDGPTNPFLQHVLLGAYRLADSPAYVRARRDARDIELIEGSLLDVPDLGRFDLVSLSNVFDWSDDALAAAWGAALSSRARPGTAVLIRQLNNRRDVRRFFTPAFEFDDALGARFVERDRSLFYDRIEVGFRRPA